MEIRICDAVRLKFVLFYQSQSIGMNPLYVMIPCTLSASFAFMLPVATPPNAIVFSYGYLKVTDMVSVNQLLKQLLMQLTILHSHDLNLFQPQAKTGIVMNIIGILSITLAINSWGKAMFSLDTFPSWANTTVV